jgi:methionine sulfoxide reductase heme-binding subunit
VSPLQRRALKTLVFVACLAPFGLIVLRAAEIGSFSLGPNPVQELLHTLGKTGLNILFVTLAISPARRLTKWNALVLFRRMLGLFSFFYLVLHFLTYAVLDWRLSWGTLWEDIAKRPYITVGMAALVLMIPLAITSTRGMQRRLKRNWVKLHRLVYPIAILALTHFFWQTKLDTLEPTIYAGILAVLLGERVYRALAARWSAAQRRRATSIP